MRDIRGSANGTRNVGSRQPDGKVPENWQVTTAHGWMGLCWLLQRTVLLQKLAEAQQHALPGDDGVMWAELLAAEAADTAVVVIDGWP